MEKQPLLSVIMPVYNAAKYVNTAVNSVLNQTFSELELICVDDCSKDNSYELLKSISEKDSRLCIIRLEENGGAGNARNVGLSYARGEYITFVDSDDYIEPDLYEKAYTLTNNGTDEIVWGLTEEYYDADGKHISSKEILPSAGLYSESKQIVKKVAELENDTLFGYQWNSIYKASVIRENNIKFSDFIFYEDYFFNLDFIKCAKSLATLENGGYHYFKRVNGSITNRFSKDYFELSYNRIESMYDFCAESGVFNNEVRNILGNRLLRYTLSALSRNNNPLSDMKIIDRKKWFVDICNLPLYSLLLPEVKSSNIAFEILKKSILGKKSMLPIILGKIVYVFRK